MQLAGWSRNGQRSSFGKKDIEHKHKLDIIIINGKGGEMTSSKKININIPGLSLEKKCFLM